MASDIRNVATVLTYTYFAGDREKRGGPVSDDAVNQYVVPTVHLEKVCSVVGFPNTTAADLKDTITLQYTAYNNSTAPITYTTVTIQDSILTSPFITIVGGEQGGTHLGNLITITPAGGLAPGQNAVYQINIQVIGPGATTNILATTATGTFTTATGSVNLDTDTCDLSYNHAELFVNKVSNPSGVVTYEQDIRYTITITNIGNVSATIAERQFQDLIPANTTFVSLDVAPGSPFGYVQTLPNPFVTNNSAITINPGQSVSVSFTVITTQQV